MIRYTHCDARSHIKNYFVTFMWCTEEDEAEKLSPSKIDIRFQSRLQEFRVVRLPLHSYSRSHRSGRSVDLSCSAQFSINSYKKCVRVYYVLSIYILYYMSYFGWRPATRKLSAVFHFLFFLFVHLFVSPRCVYVHVSVCWWISCQKTVKIYTATKEPCTNMKNGNEMLIN